MIVLAAAAVIGVACSRGERSDAGAASATSGAPAGAAAPANLTGAAADVRALTGARTRVVWVQGDGTDPYAAGDSLVLMGFDTDDGKGERVISGQRRSYVKPMLTRGGERIVFSSRPGGPGGAQVFVVNWDGSGLRALAKGFALAVWHDPADGRDWLYLGTDSVPKKDYDFTTVSRFPIDSPDRREVVWNKTPVSGDTFQVSADGRLAGGLFPWPHAGVVNLPNGELQKFGEGCWTALRDVGLPLFWFFDGAHRNVTMLDVNGNRRWMVPLNQAPGFDGAEAYHPRWANHPRFVVLSGPYNQGGTNQVRSGGAQSEVHLGRFSPDFTRVEAWARVTTNSGGDSYPDVWIDRDRSPHSIRADLVGGPRADAAAAGAAPAGTAPAPERLVVEARVASTTAIPAPRSILPYRNALVVNGYEIVKVVEGTYPRKHLLVAQWAILDGRVIEGAQRSVGTVSRMTLDRYDAHPELEGERLIAQTDAPDLPLYYDAASRP